MRTIRINELEAIISMKNHIPLNLLIIKHLVLVNFDAVLNVIKFVNIGSTWLTKNHGAFVS